MTDYTDPITKLDSWKRGGAWKPLIQLPLIEGERE